MRGGQRIRAVMHDNRACRGGDLAPLVIGDNGSININARAFGRLCGDRCGEGYFFESLGFSVGEEQARDQGGEQHKAAPAMPPQPDSPTNRSQGETQTPPAFIRPQGGLTTFLRFGKG